MASLERQAARIVWKQFGLADAAPPAGRGGWMDGWMDLLSGTGVATALRNVQWPKPFHTPAQPLRLGWLVQRTNPSKVTIAGKA